MPLRQIPTALVGFYVLLTQEVPEESWLVTHSHVKDWICDLSMTEMLHHIEVHHDVIEEAALTSMTLTHMAGVLALPS